MHLVPETWGTVFLVSRVYLAPYQYFMRHSLFLGYKEGGRLFASIFIFARKPKGENYVRDDRWREARPSTRNRRREEIDESPLVLRAIDRPMT